MSCPTLCDLMDCGPPDSFVHGISHGRILEWTLISYSKGSSQLRDWTHVSCDGRQILYHWATREAHFHVKICQDELLMVTFPMLVAIHTSAEYGPSRGETGWESSETYHLQSHSQCTYIKWTLESQSYHEYLLFQALWKTEFISLHMKHLFTHLFKLSIWSGRNSGFLSLNYPSHYKMKSMHFQQ